MPISKKVNKDFFKKWTPEMAYVLGFFAADGYITVNKRGGEFWCIQITDQDLLISIRNAIDSNHKIGVRCSKNKNESTLYRLQVGSKEMCNDLKKLGFDTCKTKRIRWPQIPEVLIPHFIRGYFDGDGNVWLGQIHKKRKKLDYSLITMFTSCSKPFILQLQKHLKGLGVQGGYVYSPENKSFSRLQLQMSDSLKLYEIMYNSGALGELFLARKKQTFEAFLKMRT